MAENTHRQQVDGDDAQCRQRRCGGGPDKPPDNQNQYPQQQHI
jgi:hypothetical protein